MNDYVEFQRDGCTMNVESQGSDKVSFWLEGPAYLDDQNHDAHDDLVFVIGREEAIEIILLLESAFS